MAHYDIFREELGLKYHGYGYALWEPSPGSLYTSVEVGDVGFIREGKFHRIFNILLPGDHPSHRNFHVPEDDEPLELKMENHIDTGSLSPNDLLSGSVIVASGGLGVAITSGSAQVSFTCSRKRGAVLSLPVHAQRQDTVARGDFGAWMVKHIDKWFAFMQDLGLGVDRMEDVVLVTGRHLTKSWANTTFSEGQADAKVSLGVQLDAVAGVNIAWNFSRKDICGAMLNIGPSGEGLPEDQCIFIRGLRASRVLKILPTRLRGAAQQALLFPHPFPPPPPPPLSYPPPSPSPPSLPRLLYSPRPHPRIGESDRRASIVPTIPPYQEPLHVLMEYIAEHAFGCDMVLVHDDDLDLVLRQCEPGSDFSGSGFSLSTTLRSHLLECKPTIKKGSFGEDKPYSAYDKVDEIYSNYDRATMHAGEQATDSPHHHHTVNITAAISAATLSEGLFDSSSGLFEFPTRTASGAYHSYVFARPVPLLDMHGYIRETFGPEMTEVYWRRLLGVDSKSVFALKFLSHGKPEVPTDFFWITEPALNSASLLYMGDGHHGWIVDSSVWRLCGPVVPQSPWPLVPNEPGLRPRADAVESSQLHPPIFFPWEDEEIILLPRTRPTTMALYKMAQYIDTAPVRPHRFRRRAIAIDIHINWPGYPPFSRKVLLKRDGKNQLHLQRDVSDVVRAFFHSCNRTAGDVNFSRWRIGQSGIGVEDILIVGLVNILQPNGWMPILQLWQ